MSTEARGLYSMAYVTIDKEESAKILAKQIVSSKLAACVNIVPKITSVYEWEGKLNEDGESLMIIKTKTSHVDDLVAFVKANHPYEVCEVITTLIDKGNPDYLSWISETVPEKNAVETGHSNNDVNSVSVIGNQDNAANGENMELVLNSTDIPKTQSSEKKKKRRRGAKKKRVTKKSKLKQNLATVEFKVKCLDFLNNTTINDTGNQHNVANMNAENTGKMPNLADILSWVPQSTLKNQKNSTPPQKLTTQEFKKKFLEFLNVNPINVTGNQHNKGKGENAGLVLNLADIPCSSSQSIPSAVETPHLNNDINTISVTRIQDNAANRKNTGHELDPAKIPITQSHLKKKKKKKPKKKITRAVRLQNWKLAEFKKRYFECFNNNTQNDTENPKNVANGEDTGLVSNLVDGPSGTTQPALINKNNFASQQNWSAEEFKKNYLELLNDKLTNVIRNQHDGANGKNTGHVLNLADIPSSASQSIPSAVETAHLNIDNNSVSVTGIQDNAANRENSGHGLNHADIPKTESPSKKKKRKRKKNKDRRSLYARLKKLAFQESKRNRLKPANYNPINVIKNQDNAANGENTGLVTNLADIPSSSSQSIQSAVETPCVNNDINTASVVGNQDNAANGENMGHVSNLADIPSSSSQLIQNTVETPRLNNDINTVSVIGNQDNAANGENMEHVSNLTDINILTQSNLINEENSAPPQS